MDKTEISHDDTPAKLASINKDPKVQSTNYAGFWYFPKDLL